MASAGGAHASGGPKTPTKTPTKLARRPAGQTGSPGPRKLGTPRSTKQAKPEVSRDEKSTQADIGEEAGDVEEETPRPTATKKPAPSKLSAKDSADDDVSNISDVGDDLKEQEPKPLDDDDEDDAGGNQDQADDDIKVPQISEGGNDEEEDDGQGEAEEEASGEDEDEEEETAEQEDEEEEVAPQRSISAAKGAKQIVNGKKGKAAPTQQAQSGAGKAKQAISKDKATDTEDASSEVDDDAAQETPAPTDEQGDEGEDVSDDAQEAAEDLEEHADVEDDDVEADDAEDTVAGATANVDEEEGEIEDQDENEGEEEDEDEGQDEDQEEGEEEDEEETAEAGDAAAEVADGAEDEAEEAAEATEGVEDEADEAAEVTEGAEDEAGEAAEGAEGAEDQAEEADTPDLSILKGLEVDEEGLIHDNEGNAIGHLVEGDAEDLAGYPVGDDGEILDEDGDLVGRCELLPEKVEELKRQAAGEDKEDEGEGLPGVEILEGLSCDSTGLVLNDDGDTIGQVVEGEVSKLKGRPINEKGEILDDDGNVIGRVELTDEAIERIRQIQPDQDEEEEGEEDQESNDQQGDDTEEFVEEKGEAIEEEAEEELPGIEALEGQKINDEGQIVDEEGNVLGELAEGDVEAVKGMSVDDQGQVIDDDGNVIGKIELAEGAEEHLANAANKPDLRILEGLKVNKKGKILDEEGEPIGELIDGDNKECAGKRINEKGEVIDKSGNVLGRVKVIPGEAADEATRSLLERLGELEEDSGLPGLETLEGHKVNKKGKILNEDGEPIGELVDGDIAKCAGKKCNDQGEVLDNRGKVIGRVKTLALPDAQEEAEEGEGVPEDALDEAAEKGAEAAEDAQSGEEGEEGEEEGEDATALPPLSALEGLTVNKSGKIIDGKGVIIGELVEGDAKKLSKSGTTCDAEGQFWDNKGHVIGRAKTVPGEDSEEEAPFAGLEGLIVNKEGFVEDENGNVVGKVTEGNAKKLVGRAVDEDGDILDKKGSVVGHAERYEEEEPEEEQPEEAADLSFLAGKSVNKQGNVIGDEGVPVARLVEGNAKECAGKKLDKSGQLWNDRGEVIGRVELIPENEREAKPEGPFAGLQGLRVAQGGNVVDEDGNVVGTIVEGNPKRLVGLSVDEDGDIIDKYGNVKGHAEPVPEEEEPEAADLSILENKVLNKQGFVVGEDGIPVGKLVEGNVKELAGRRCDGEGKIHGDTGKVVGRCELIPENERVSRAEGPFAGLEGLHVVKDGYVEDDDGNVVGVLVEGNPKRLIGHAVDEDGDIIDKYGNVKGHADPYEEEEAAEVDLGALAGCTVNKAGNVVDGNGKIMGRVVEGDVKNMIGRKVDGKGQIWDNSGKVVGRAELADGVDTNPDGPFSGFDTLTVAKDGTVVTASGDIVGRIIEGDVKKLVGHHPDEDGDITDKNGNSIGKAERWEPDEKERRINPMSGMHVNKDGEVRDQNGDLIGRLTAGDLGHCTGLEIDDNGYVIDNDGNKVGEVTLLENIAEEEPEEEETDEERQRKEEIEIAKKMGDICQQTLERVQPVCKKITEYIEQADRTPREELDQEELVNNVKPLIEEGGRILEECNGSLRALDPDGSIAARAKGRAGSSEASPEEYRLADLLKELTSTVVTCIDNAKKKINDMPHAKKKLNPLWGLMTEPLFQILAAVGLLLAGVLNLVGRLLSGLGLGGIVNSLLGGLGINKILGGLGLGGISESLGGKKGEKKGGAGGLPVIGGLLGKK